MINKIEIENIDLGNFSEFGHVISKNTTSEKIKSAYLEQTSLKTFIDVEEVIGMLVYLISPLAKKITGQMLVIDGNTESLSMKYMD